MNELDRVEAFFAPWQSIYSESTAISTAILAVHLVALLVAGGMAISADRAVLGRDERPDRSLHVFVLVGLAASSLSGLLMFAADAGVYLVSPVFWAKLALIALLLFNGTLLYRAGAAGDRDRLRVTARISSGLWIATTVLGAVLTSTG